MNPYLIAWLWWSSVLGLPNLKPSAPESEPK